MLLLCMKKKLLRLLQLTEDIQRKILFPAAYNFSIINAIKKTQNDLILLYLFNWRKYR